MDMWVVAAAAGAGYLAKYLKNLSRNGEGFSGLSSVSPVDDRPSSPSLIQNICDNTRPICRSANKKSENHASTEIGNELLSGIGLVEKGKSVVTSTNAASTSGREMYEGVLEPEVYAEQSLSTLSSGFTMYQKPKESGDGIRLDGDIGDTDTPQQYTSDVGTTCGHERSKKPLRSRRSHMQFLKPLNSMESCLMAHLYKERAQTEEYILGRLQSPCTPLRPFFVSDGRKIISRGCSDSFGVQFKDEKSNLWGEAQTETEEKVLGVPHLPKIGSSKYSRRQKGGKEKSHLVKPSILVNDSEIHSQDGSPAGAMLFCLGISMGIISMILANKIEVEKLKVLLNQTESLVKDLQEECEMKDSMIVKELVNEGSHSLDACGAPSCSQEPVSFPSQSDIEAVADTTYVGSNVRKTSGNQGPISVIEAELEAELERLELSMKESTLRGRLQDVIELDPDFVAEVVQGELRADVISRRTNSEPDVDQCSSSNASTLSAKHAVSPRELCLRLHEVRQTRLEVRISELEAALEKSQKRVKQLESENVHSWKWKESPNIEYSSTQDSPISVEVASPLAQPLIMNLSGDALDAFDEAFEELKSTHGSENNSYLDKVSSDNSQEGRASFGGIDCENQISARHVSVPQSADIGDDEASHISLAFQQSSDASPPNGSAEDDDMTLLIKQIVERTRQGSPALFNAHRAMVSLDKNKQ